MPLHHPQNNAKNQHQPPPSSPFRSRYWIAAFVGLILVNQIIKEWKQGSKQSGTNLLPQSVSYDKNHTHARHVLSAVNMSNSKGNETHVIDREKINNRLQSNASSSTIPKTVGNTLPSVNVPSNGTKAATSNSTMPKTVGNTLPSVNLPSKGTKAATDSICLQKGLDSYEFNTFSPKENILYQKNQKVRNTTVEFLRRVLAQWPESVVNDTKFDGGLQRAIHDLRLNGTGALQKIVHDMGLQQKNPILGPSLGYEFALLPSLVTNKSAAAISGHGSSKPFLILGKKLVEHKPIKVVFMGGSNTDNKASLPYVSQVEDMMKKEMGYNVANYTNLGKGGMTSCHFATTFTRGRVYEYVDNSDLVFLEFTVNDNRMLKKEQQHSCMESLIRRIYSKAPNALIVLVSLNYREWHQDVTQYYNLPQIFLGPIQFNLARTYMRQNPRDPILSSFWMEFLHVNNLGGFLIRHAAAVLLQQLQWLYCLSETKVDDTNTRNPLPPRLYEPAEDFDYKFMLGDSGQTIVTDKAHEFRAACGSLAPFNKTNQTIAPDSRGVQDQCAKMITSHLPSVEISQRRRPGPNTIPCQKCSSGPRVSGIGAGWVLCRHLRPEICRQLAIQHDHCSFGVEKQENTGVFMEAFEADNRPTPEHPASVARQVNVTMRVVKGYDPDFGQALVMVSVKETASVIVNLVDTKWDIPATVPFDVRLEPSLLLPSPSEHSNVTISVVIVPLLLRGDPSANRQLSPNATTPLCRLYVQELLGTLV